MLDYSQYDVAGSLELVYSMVRIVSSNEHYLQLYAFPYNGSTVAGDVSVYEDVQCIDLTEMFGAGNEPTTIVEFKAMFPHWYYPYCAGSVLNREQINALAIK